MARIAKDGFTESKFDDPEVVDAMEAEADERNERLRLIEHRERMARWHSITQSSTNSPNDSNPDRQSWRG